MGTPDIRLPVGLGSEYKRTVETSSEIYKIITVTIEYSMYARHCTYVMSPSSQDSWGWAILLPVL